MARPWPWDESALKRRERVALSYRALAEKLDPVACADLDTQMLEYGQRWIVAKIVPYQDEDLLSADLVADFAQVNLKTVYEWRRRGLPSVVTPDGLRFRFHELRKWVGGSRSR
jgi:hypothetical protein